jgi:coenzyme PQQ biosynthesis protein PqqD
MAAGAHARGHGGDSDGVGAPKGNGRNDAAIGRSARAKGDLQMTPQTVPRQAFGFFVEEMEAENLLYRLGAHKAIHLNDTATVIWKLCDGSRTVQDIIDMLKKEYPDSEAAVPADVREAIEQLIGEGALLEAGRAAPAESDSANAGTERPS